MRTYVALLRGINVGGNRIIKMADLRAMFERAGATDVETYIQSGNVVFTHVMRSSAKLAAHLEAELALTMVVRTATEMAAVVEDNPFPKAEPKALHVVFLRRNADAAIDLDPKPFLPEKWQSVGKQVYLFMPNGVGRSPLAVALTRKATATDATVRNWRTVQTLALTAGYRAA